MLKKDKGVMKRLFLLAILLLALAACGGEATPDPTEVALMVEQGIAATASAMPTNTPAQPTSTPLPATATPLPLTETPTSIPPTATPTPIPTNTPTITPTSTPVGPERAEYRNERFGFAFDYPAVVVLTERGREVYSGSDEDYFFSVQVIQRDTTREEEQDASAVAEMYATREAQRMVSIMECEASEVLDSESWSEGPQISQGWMVEGTCSLVDDPMFLPLTWQAATAVGDKFVYRIFLTYGPKDDYLPGYVLASFELFEPSLPAAYVEISVDSANLRLGPGTTYPIGGKAAKGAIFEIIGRNAQGSWWQICCQEDQIVWAADSIVEAGGETDRVEVATNIPTPPPPPATATPRPSLSSDSLQIGETLEGNGWRFKVYDVKKRKVVYFYDNSYVAQGHFLLVFVEATNAGSGTSYFAKDLRPILVDAPGNVFPDSFRGGSYAEWQFGGLDSFYTDANPGETLRMVEAYDVPDGAGEVLLSLNIPAWIYLGDFGAMPIEE